MFKKNLTPFFHDDHCGCGCGCGCEHEHDHDHDEEVELGECIVTMVDEETGEEYQFAIVDDFDFEGEMYSVLMTLDEEPESLIVKVVSDSEEGGDYFMSLEDEEYDRVAEEYQRILEETAAEEDSEA